MTFLIIPPSVGDRGMITCRSLSPLTLHMAGLPYALSTCTSLHSFKEYQGTSAARQKGYVLILNKTAEIHTYPEFAKRNPNCFERHLRAALAHKQCL